VDLIDQAGPVRPGEELDQAAVEAFVKANLPDIEGPLTVKQFPSGYSNLTYLLAAGSREMVLRRPPFGYKAKSAHDMGREYRVLTALHPIFPYAPRPLAYTEDESILGSPFYIMERIKGLIIHRDLPPGLSLTPDQAARLCRNMLQVQLEFHNLDYQKAGLGDLGKPAGYVQRQVLGTNKRYRAARTPDALDCEELMGWLEENMPPDTEAPGLIHNDFSLHNLVLDPEDPCRIIGVLDWELTTVGDPLMDLGLSMSYWVQADDPPEMQSFRNAPTNLPGMLTRRQMLDLYQEKSGRRIGDFVFYYCFGLFRMAVVVQQMYYRYYHGQTRDQRFKQMPQWVQALEETARRAIRSGKI